ncbi:MAG: hypothetical protein M3044_19480 [Thermoproteota archaeon]|nr:hypothetical protein [Thermoproteota archaeon]
MRSAKMIDDALRVCNSEEYSRFQSFDDALDELTCKLYEDEYYRTPNSSICIFYSLEIHRFQTIASSSISSFQYSDAFTRTDNENSKARYPSTTLTIVEIKTNQNEFDDYIENIINKHTYALEDLTKDEYRKLIIDYLVHLQMEKMQLNPLEIAANHEMQSKDVKRLFSELQTTPQKSELALLLEELYNSSGYCETCCKEYMPRYSRGLLKFLSSYELRIRVKTLTPN